MHDLERGRIAVTGGAGLIGSAVVWALNRRGLENILVVDRLDCSEKWRHLVPLRFADYLDADEFEARATQDRSLDDVATIIHLGACSVDHRARCRLPPTQQLRVHEEAGPLGGGKRRAVRLRVVGRNLWRPRIGALGRRRPSRVTSAQRVRLLETAFRSLRKTAATRRTHLRPQILQRFRAQRRAQGRDAQHRAESLRADSRARQRPALQELSLRSFATASSSATSSTSRTPSK